MNGILARTAVSPQAGPYEDEEARDNERGFERDETDNRARLGSYLLRLVRETDARIPVEWRAPRTVAEMRARITIQGMAPGSTRQPVLLMTRPLHFRTADDACPVCGYWRCRCGGA